MNRKKIVALGLITAVACSNLSVLATANPENAVQDTVVSEASDLFTIGLEIAVEEANEITEADLEHVVPVVVAEFNEALKEAEALLASVQAGDAVTQAQIDSSLERLTGALHLLSHTGDKSDLTALVAEIEALNADDYTVESWEALQTVLNSDAVQSVLDDENALDGYISVAYNMLVVAKAQLVSSVKLAPSAPSPTIIDITETTATITWKTPVDSPEEIGIYVLCLDDVEGRVAVNNEGVYSVTFKNLNPGTVYTTSLKSVGVNEMESEAVITKFETLSVVEVDKSELEAVVGRVDALVEGEYTEATWNKLQTALEEANGVLANEDATQAEVDAAKTKLENAIDSLESVESGLITSLVAPAEVTVFDTASYELGLDDTVEAVKVTYTWHEDGEQHTFSDVYDVKTTGTLEIDRVLRFVRKYKVEFTPIVDGKEVSEESKETVMRVVEKDVISSVVGNGNNRSTTIDKVGDDVTFTIKTSTDVDTLEFNFTTSNNYKEYYTSNYEDVNGERVWTIVRPIRTDINEPHKLVISAIRDGYLLETSKFTITIAE